MNNEGCVSIGEVEFLNYKIKKTTLERWLFLVYQLSNVDRLENAITVAKQFASSAEEQEATNIVSILYRAECSGEIDPPVEMMKFYEQIVKGEIKQ